MNKAILTLLLLIPVAVHAQSITKSDFAYSVDVEVKADTYNEVDITEKMYSGIQSPRLYDVRVYDPDGIAVPYRIKRQTQPPRTDVETYLNRQYFPVSVPLEKAQSDDVRLSVTRNMNGTNIVFRTNSKADGQSKEKGLIYIVDLGGTPEDNKISSLKLRWNDEDVERTKLRVSTSNDLTLWRHAGEGTLVNLKHDGNVLRHDTIDISRGSYYHRYLKITSDNPARVRLQDVITLSRRQEEIKQQPTWATIKGVQLEDSRYYYKTPGNFPIDFLKITPVNYNSVYRIVVRAGHTDKMIKQVRFQGNSYLLRIDGEEIRSNTIPLSGSTPRHWTVEVKDKDQDSLPEISFELGWFPYVVHFLSSKQGRYTVAYGSANVQHPGAALPAILSAEYEPVLVSSGETRVAGGGKQLQPAPDKPNLAKWMLWTILSITLAVIGFMAFRLFGHMNKKE